VKTVAADREGVRLAARALDDGGVVVLPTDTVYGLAARPDMPEAVHAVYRAKGRPEGMHLPVLAASISQVRALGVAISEPAARLARRWWPGPLTLVFGFDPATTRPGWLAGRDEVAVRIPDHAFVRTLVERTGVLLVTSANPHGMPTARRCAEVADELGDEVALAVDGGELAEVPSTLVNVRGPRPAVEREGAIPRDAFAGALEDESSAGDEPRQRDEPCRGDEP
jgi:L-threonylcarbamoyladenylate synthase